MESHSPTTFPLSPPPRTFLPQRQPPPRTSPTRFSFSCLALLGPCGSGERPFRGQKRSLSADSPRRLWTARQENQGRGAPSGAPQASFLSKVSKFPWNERFAFANHSNVRPSRRISPAFGTLPPYSRTPPARKPRIATPPPSSSLPQFLHLSRLRTSSFPVSLPPSIRCPTGMMPVLPELPQPPPG